MTPAAPQPLLEEAHRLRGQRLQDLVATDHARMQALSISVNGWLADFSKERLSVAAWDALLQHAEATNLPAWIRALFAGEKINLSEARPALHTALRQPGDSPVFVDGHDVLPAIRETRYRMRALTEGVRSGRRTGSTGLAFTDIVHLGIGGSDLGPRLVCDALATAPGTDVARGPVLPPQESPDVPPRVLPRLQQARLARLWRPRGAGPRPRAED